MKIKNKYGTEIRQSFSAKLRPMKRLLMLVFVLTVVMPTRAQSQQSPGRAQSLEIGGITLTVGMSQALMLQKLKQVYSVEYNENGKAWYIQQKDQPDKGQLGRVATEKDAVIGIEKFYSAQERYGELFEKVVVDLRGHTHSTCTSVLNEHQPDPMSLDLSYTCGPYQLGIGVSGLPTEYSMSKKDRISLFSATLSVGSFIK